LEKVKWGKFVMESEKVFGNRGKSEAEENASFPQGDGRLWNHTVFKNFK